MNEKVMVYASAIIALSMIVMVIPASAQVQMADDFGVNNAMGNPNTYVEVPVNITNVKNGPIATIKFDITYDDSCLLYTSPSPRDRG